MSEKKSKNGLLIFFRKWHGWLGVVLSIFIITTCLSGIILNHKGLFLSEKKKEYKSKKDGEIVAALTLPIAAASEPMQLLNSTLLAAHQAVGSTEFEKVELKNEHGELICKVVIEEDREVLGRMDHGELKIIDTASASKSKKEMEEFNLGKAIKDLHTGKLGGMAGILLIDLVSFVIILLTLSGLYLWGLPIYRKRKAQAQYALAKNKVVPA